MRELSPGDVVGKRITEIIISVPNRPVSMGDQSLSASYIRLDNGVVLDLNGPVPPLRAYEGELATVKRDTPYEAEFQAAIGQTVSEVLLTTDVGCLCVVTDGGLLITEVPALFWERPCIYRRSECSINTEPLWK